MKRDLLIHLDSVRLHDVGAAGDDLIKDRHIVLVDAELRVAASPGISAAMVYGSFTFWDSASDALALLDRLEIDRAIFVGTSQGGFVSLRAALLAPDRVRGLAVMGTSGSNPAFFVA